MRAEQIQSWRALCDKTMPRFQAKASATNVEREALSRKRTLEPGEIDEGDGHADQAKRSRSRLSEDNSVDISPYDFDSEDNYLLCLTMQALCVTLSVSSEVQYCAFRLLHEYLLGSDCALVEADTRAPLIIACVWLAGKVLSETYRAHKLKRIIPALRRVLELHQTTLAPFVPLPLDSVEAQSVTPASSASPITPGAVDTGKLLVASVKDIESSILRFIQFDFESVSLSPLSRLQSDPESSSRAKPWTLVERVGSFSNQCDDGIVDSARRKCSNPALLFYPTSALHSPADIAAALLMITLRDKHVFDSARGGAFAVRWQLDVSNARQLCKQLQRQSDVYASRKALVDSVLSRRSSDPAAAGAVDGASLPVINEVSPVVRADQSQPSPPDASEANSFAQEIVDTSIARNDRDRYNRRSPTSYSTRVNRNSIGSGWSHESASRHLGYPHSASRFGRHEGQQQSGQWHDAYYEGDQNQPWFDSRHGDADYREYYDNRRYPDEYRRYSDEYRHYPVVDRRSHYEDRRYSEGQWEYLDRHMRYHHVDRGSGQEWRDRRSQERWDDERHSSSQNPRDDYWNHHRNERGGRNYRESLDNPTTRGRR